MLQFLWLTRLRERWLGKVGGSSRKRYRRVHQQRLYHRLELERLEHRIVPTVILENSFQGANLDQSSGGWVPPDTQGGVGPNSYVQTVNATVSVYNKTTGVRILQDSLDDFLFTKGGLNNVGGLADAFSAYDSVAGRFIVGDIDSNFAGNNAITFAVSKSSNPTTLTTADWYFYEIDSSEPSVSFQDYPGNIGYNNGALVITENSFGGTSHVLVNSISMDALTSGATLTKGTNYFQNDFSGWSMRPATMQDSASPNDPMWFVEEAGDNKSINVVEMSGVLSDTATFTTTNLAVNPYHTAVDELNPDGSAINGNTDSRIMNVSMENGILVAGHQVSDAAGDLDEVQWYEVNTNGGTPTLQQQGDVSGGPGTYYAYPGIAINSGGLIGMSYIASGSASGFMSTYITGRKPSDPIGTMETAVAAMLGTVTDNDGREGDMSPITVDSDGTFWISNEVAVYNPGFLADSWGTVIAQFTTATLVSSQTTNASTTYSGSNSQVVPLSATVTDIKSPGSPVNEGIVTFIIKKGTTVVGSAVGNVVNGAASANYTVPAGQSAGNYTIVPTYKDALGNYFDGSDTNATLTIKPAQALTLAGNSIAAYSYNPNTVTLNATLTDASFVNDKVTEGTVTFTVMNGIKALATAQGTVSNGTASANLTLPAGVALGNYTIAVSYSDSAGNFIDIGNTGATLIVNPANIVTTAANVVTSFSLNPQTVAFSAALTDSSVPSDTLIQGNVTFTVKKGTTVVGSVQGAVNSGVANANFTLPGGLAAGNYTIGVSYTDSSGNFLDSSDNNGTLAVSTANVTTTANNGSAFYSAEAQTVVLHATLADLTIPTDSVGEGAVTFTVLNNGAIVDSEQGNVSNGTASATLNLPAGLAVGSYIVDVSYKDSPSNYIDAGDTSGTLTVLPAPVVVTAAPANLTFSTAPQSVNLSATVANNAFPNDIVKEGAVTFTLLSGNTVIGNAVANAVNGAASTTFTWSAGRPAGSYTIAVSYADSQGNFADSKNDISSTLTVGAASVTTAATATNPLSLISSSSAQNVTLNATVTDTSFAGDTVYEGTVTFTVKDKNGNTVLDSKGNSTVQGTVSNGKASAVFSAPGGLAVGNYTVLVSYTDSQGNFSDNGSGDTSTTFGVLPANVFTTASNASAIFSPNTQTLALTASVANTSVPTNTVGEGVVIFTLQDKNGNTVKDSNGNSSIQGAVVGGTAKANFSLPAGLVPGNYSIGVSYSDTTGSGNFIDNGDTGATLTITSANVTTRANAVAATYSPNAQTLSLSANVTDSSNSNDIVNEGAVTFTVKNGTTVIGNPIQGNVVNGKVSANFNLPAGQALGSYTISVSYSASSGNFTDTSDVGTTLTLTPANVTTTASNASAVYRPATQSVALTANVTDTSIPSDTVNEGVVTFTVKNGSTVLGSAQGNVVNGTATASFSLPGGQAAGSYTITVSYNDSTSHFLDAGDTGATLTLASANVTTRANNVTAAFSPNAQTLSLSANVTDTSILTDSVSQGSVKFTVMSGSTTIGTATSLVSNGKANASLSWPAGQALGNYTIAVSYSDSANNFTDSGDTGAVLTVGPANVTTKANSVSTIYSQGAQTLTLSANLTNTSIPSDLVTEGTVKFTVMSGSTALGSVQGTVSNGTANADFNVPAGLSAGNYTIAVSFSDNKGYFVDAGDTSGTLSITPASVTTTASSTSTTFSTGSQTLALNATATDPGPTVPNVVNEGVVTFTILSGSSVVGSVQGAVSGNHAHANFALPPGLSAGNYSVVVSYSDSQGNFADTGDVNGNLAVGAAGTAVELLQAHFSPDYTNLTVTETITAHVSSAGSVDRGVVSFVISNGTHTANVDGNGNATITLTLPMLNLLHPQTIDISYADAGHNLTNSANTGTASWQYSTPLLPTYAAFTPNTVTMDLFGLFVTYRNGVLTEIDFGSTHLVFSYDASGQLDQVTFDGTNLLP